MNVASLTSPRWAVSTRTDGEVLTAGVTHHGIDLVLLGVPTGFTPAELEGWLGDLAGVAAETSATDPRIRAIPALLHHSLTGLLFSHAELWDRTSGPAPCSAAFVDSPDGAAFGWVGDARATLRVDGREYAPQWVRVRDEAGREAFATVLPPGVSAQLTLEYWRNGDRSAAAPCAIEADWSVRTAPAEAPAAHGAPVPVVSEPERAAESAAQRAPEPAPQIPPSQGAASVAELPASLPTQQPSLAASRFERITIDSMDDEIGDDDEIGLPVEELLEEHALAAAAPPAVPLEESARASIADAAAESVTVSPVDAAVGATEFEADVEPGTPKGKHPVGRWLDRVLGWGRRSGPAPAPQPERSGESAPLSVYDSLISESVPCEPPLEQTSMSWSEPSSAPRSEDTPIPEAVAEPLAPEVAQAFTPMVVEDEPEPAADPVAEIAPPPVIPLVAPPEVAVTPAAPVAPHSPGSLQAAGLAEILLAAKPSPPAPPAAIQPQLAVQPPVVPSEPVRDPEAMAFAPRRAPALPLPPTSSAPIEVPGDAAASESLPVLSPLVLGDPSQPLEIVHEPVGADAQRFGIPQFPAERMAQVEPVDPALEFEPLSLTACEPQAGPRSLIAAQTESLGQGAARPSMADTLRRATPSSRWPTASELETKPWHQQPWSWAVLVVALFAAGWLLGHLQTPGPNAGPGPVERMLRAVGLGGARFEAVIETEPPGAWISVDGKDIARRTPASIELPPGEHTLTLTLTELGSITVPVKGQNKDRITLNESLHGDLEIFASDPSIPISVSVDRKPMGFAPVKMEQIAPGLHEVQFSGPGMPAWAQTVQVGVRQTSQVVAHPISSPATGIIQVQAQLTDDEGASPLNGAQVFVDGELRGVTPASLELSRGPHSLKLTWRGESTPVQVIDLPGGNQRFAEFQFGLDLDQPHVQLLTNNRVMSADQVTMISATIVGLQPGDVRESWLHVRASEGLWRRYPMTVMKGPNGAVVTSVFPPSAFDAQGNTRWYVSGQTLQGDEYFSEIQKSSLASTRPKPKSSPTP